MFKKFLAGALSVAMMFGMASVLPEEVTDKLSFAIEASAVNTYEDYEYAVLEDNTIIITKYNGNSSAAFIPSEIDGKPVTEIGDSAFSGCSTLESVTIPNSVIYIYCYAFQDCQNLINVTIPDSVINISWSAFANCTSIKNLAIPKSVKSIGESAFAGCFGLESVSLPENETEICYKAFYNCTSLKSVCIPKEIKEIESYAFGYHDGDADPTNNEDFQIYCYDDSIGEKYAVDNKFYDYIILDEIVDGSADCFIYNELSDGTLEITGVKSVMETLNIPKRVDGKIVSTISSFEYTDDQGMDGPVDILKTINVPLTVEKICYNSPVNGIYMYPNLKNINVSAYNGRYTSIDGILYSYLPWPFSIKTLQICPVGKTEVTIPDNERITDIASCAFYHCYKITSIEIPSSVRTISSNAFSECTHLETIKLNEGLQYISNQAFCDLAVYEEGVIIGHEMTAGGYVPSNTSVLIPKSVKDIGPYAFGYYETGRTKIENYQISCYSGTAGEQYAIDNGFDYVLLDAPTTKPISTCTATLTYTALTYSPDGINADKYLTVKDGSKTLVQGVDYETSYKNNKAVGYQTCTLTIAGKGDYSGTIYKKLTIKPPKLAAPTLTTKNSAIVVNWKKTTTYALGYQVIYDKVADFDTSAAGHTDDYHTTTITDLDTLTKTLSAYTKPGETWYVKVRAFITNDGTTGGTRYGTFSAAKKIVVKGNVSTASIPYASYTYSGSAIKPAVTVKDSKGNKLSASNYTVDYTNNTKVGTATITITGKGNYQGTITKTFVIKPKAGTLTLTAGTAAFKASWTKNTTATGYQITYSKDKNFVSGVTNYTVSKNTTTSANFSSKPKSGETWYVKYRPYITVNGTKYYGSYSTVKTVKTK